MFKYSAPAGKDISPVDQSHSDEMPPEEAPVDAPMEPPIDASEMTADQIGEGLKNSICSKSPVLGACLADGALIRYEPPDQVIIEVDSANANVNLLQRKKNIAGIEKHCNDFFKKPVKVSIDVKHSGPDPAERKKKDRQLENEAKTHPVVDAAVKTFNGKILDIKIL